jgi:hypothetical protein
MTRPREYTLAELRAIERETWNEKTFTRKVVDLAREYGWRAVHFETGIVAGGHFRTPFYGDEGFPDVIAARNSQVVAAELKCGKNKPTDGQLKWLHQLGLIGVHVDTFVWYPHDWLIILETFA